MADLSPKEGLKNIRDEGTTPVTFNDPSKEGLVKETGCEVGTMVSATVEIKPLPEQAAIINSAGKFADYLTSRWSQLDKSRRMVIDIADKGPNVDLPELPGSIETEPTLNYYISGSLATMLLAQAGSFSEIDEKDINGFREVQTRNIPEKAQNILATFARPIGDLDFVTTDSYRKKQAAVQASFKEVGEDEYTRLRSLYLWKGGGGPSFDEIPENAKKCLNHGENQLMLFCDPVESYGAKRIAKVNVEGKDYYIARPDSILAYKVLHLLQSYDHKPDKFNADFGKLLYAMKEIYTEEELLQTTRQVLSDYEKAMESCSRAFKNDGGRESYEKHIPNFINKVLSNKKVATEIRGFIQAIGDLG